ncbi:MAG: S9 family peptidase [Wenzhouxiangellaceae bacterium]|nr:S9 family peptidase [Wenzhouxiangellaceae bacterium]
MKRFVPILLLALVFMPAFSQAAGMTLEQIAELRQVSSVSISPSGDQIAYVRSVPRDLSTEPDGPAWQQLHVIDVEGVSKPYVAGQVNVASIGWTPDGNDVTFLASRGDDETTRLYAIALSGGEARVLASLETDISGYSFSPDGQRVAVTALEPKGSEQKALEEAGFNQVVFEEDIQNRRIYIHDLSDEAAEPRMLAPEGSVQDVAWSPAGDRLAIKISPRQLVDDTLIFTKIRIIDLDGEEIGRIDSPGKLGEMAWSPDGKHLAFIATNIVNDPREGRLMMAGASGGEFTELLPGLEAHVWHLAWVKKDYIGALIYEGTGVNLTTIRADGQNRRTMLRNGPIFTGISSSDGGHIALVGNTPAHPNEAFRLELDQPVRLTDSNPWLHDVDLARQQVLRYTARDGLEIEGILFYPLDYQEGQRYPLILNVHGGPEAHFSNGWLTRASAPAQHAAAKGYLVFFQNYRGSTGRGVEFTLTSQGRPAMEEFDDLVDGIDYLVEQGMADVDKVGITGGSYGGYASAWGATHYSERFAAAVMNVGLSNQIAAFGTSDIPWEFNLVHLGKWPWEDWDLFQQASPLYHVTQAKTPILILHGDADPRVDPTQSRMFYRFLKLQQDPPPVRLVLYPGEGHGNRRAASQYDYSLRLMRWMDHYLTGEGGQPPPLEVDYAIDLDTDNKKLND